MTRVLITGGTGFIGSRLALRCLDAGERVRVLGQRNNPPERARAGALAGTGVDLIDASVTDAQALRLACAGMNVVYHLAAAQHEANVPDSHFHEVNVAGTRSVFEAAVEAGVSRVVHGSSIGVFADRPGGPVTEVSPLEPEHVYGVTKLAGERVAEGFRDRISLAVIRISETYGPEDRRLLKLFRAIADGRAVRIGSCRNLHHPIFVDDLVEALRHAAASEPAPPEPVVVAGPEPLSTDEMIDGIARALGRPPPRLRIPLAPLLWTAALLEATLRPIGVQPPLHRRRMNFFVRSFRFDLEPARRALGFSPAVAFDDGAAATAEWYRARGLLRTSGSS
jgi:nucleoside-diphosphate-sugar epimerase